MICLLSFCYVLGMLLKLFVLFLLSFGDDAGSVCSHFIMFGEAAVSVRFVFLSCTGDADDIVIWLSLCFGDATVIVRSLFVMFEVCK